MTVKLATLHNEEDIRRKDIRDRRHGDRAARRRVIPQVVGPVLRSARQRGEPFRMPERCPACDTPVVQPEGEAMHRCPNPACPAEGIEWLKHFAQPRRDGHRRRRREAGGAAASRSGLVDAAAGPLLADRRRPAAARRLPAALGRERDRLDRGVEAAAVRPGAVRARDPTRRARERRSCWPSTSARSTRSPGRAGGDRGGRGRRAGDRRGALELVPGRGARRGRAGARGRGRADERARRERAVDGPLAGKVVVDRQPSRDTRGTRSATI